MYMVLEAGNVISSMFNKKVVLLTSPILSVFPLQRKSDLCEIVSIGEANKGPLVWGQNLRVA